MFKFLEYTTRCSDTIKVYEENETMVIINWDKKEVDFIEDFKNPIWLLCERLQIELEDIVYLHEDYVQGIIIETEEDGNMEKLKNEILSFCQYNCIKF